VKQAENLAFRQMALQGQSVFVASGDAAAFDCSRFVPSDRSLQVGDPVSQPFVTAVGGTSFVGTFDPGTNPNPTYPGREKEHVWFEGCSPSAGCLGGGGGVSRFWAKPSYQVGPGVVERGLSRSGAYCGQRAGVLCREVPDVSLNSDPGSGYAVYCTDPVDCGSRGWQQIGGTSAAAPLWSTIAALMDSFQHKRVGLFNFFLYRADSPDGYSQEFHDITIGNNGFYPAHSSYDMATGVGTANIYDWVRNV
jgi:kumamolisin